LFATCPTHQSTTLTATFFLDNARPHYVFRALEYAVFFWRISSVYELLLCRYDTLPECYVKAYTGRQIRAVDDSKLNDVGNKCAQEQTTRIRPLLLIEQKEVYINNIRSPNRCKNLLIQELFGFCHVHPFFADAVSCFKEMESTTSCHGILFAHFLLSFGMRIA
jgi:hypothetical protein